MLPSIHDLIEMFAKINQDPECFAPLSDTEYYADQIANIFDVSDEDAQIAANQMAEVVNSLTNQYL